MNNFESNPINLTEQAHLRKPKFDLKLCIFSIIAFLSSIFLLYEAMNAGASAASDSFSSAKENASDEAYSYFFEKSYTSAEKAHHVSTSISVNIGDLHEEQSLEVLQVRTVSYEVPSESDKGKLATLVSDAVDALAADPISWLEVPGYGVFTVNLQTCEFIIDNTRQHVLIRATSPELEDFSIDYANVKSLYFEKGGLFKNSAKCGADEARKQLQNAELKMHQDINNNQQFYKQAKTSAETIIKNLVKQLNPQLPDLTVEVEFID